MEAMTARQSWSDDRIDGLEHKVDEGFRRVDQRFEQVDQRFDRLERRMENGFRDVRGEMKAGFDGIDARLDSFQHTLTLFSGGLIAALLGIIATQV